MTDQANSIQRKEIELAGRKLPLVIASPQASSQQVLAELEIPQPEEPRTGYQTYRGLES